MHESESEKVGLLHDSDEFLLGDLTVTVTVGFVDHFLQLAEPIMTPVYDHTAVTDGMTVPGPALIETPRTTYLVEPGWTLTMGLLGSAVMVKNA